MTWTNINELIYPIGHVMATSTNQSPAETIGGTWTCIHKTFEEYGGNITVTKGSSASEFECSVLRTGNTVRFRIRFVPNVSVADTARHMGTIDLASAGLSGLGYALYNYPAGSDAPGGFAMCQIDIDGKVQTVEAVGKTSGTLDGNSSYYLDFTQVCYPSRMLDDACKQWFWQKTA